MTCKCAVWGYELLIARDLKQRHPGNGPLDMISMWTTCCGQRTELQVVFTPTLKIYNYIILIQSNTHKGHLINAHQIITITHTCTHTNSTICIGARKIMHVLLIYTLKLLSSSMDIAILPIIQIQMDNVWISC